MKRSLLALIAIACACSCNKKNTATPQPADGGVSDYASLKPGNYWVYEQYMIDSVGWAGHALGIFDSCYVEKDTTIGGLVYHKYVQPDPNIGGANLVSYLRDSLSYVVDNNGVVHFSSTDFTNVFRSSWWATNTDIDSGYHSSFDTVWISEKMGFQNETVTVPAGTFVTSTFRRVYSFPASYPLGRSRELDYRYAAGAGIVQQSLPFYMAERSSIERKLVRYHVQ